MNSEYLEFLKSKIETAPGSGFSVPEGDINPALKPVNVLKKLIEIFTDPGETVIDPCCGSGSTLRAASELGRNAFGFEIDRNFYREAKGKMLCNIFAEGQETENTEQTSLF